MGTTRVIVRIRKHARPCPQAEASQKESQRHKQLRIAQVGARPTSRRHAMHNSPHCTRSSATVRRLAAAAPLNDRGCVQVWMSKHKIIAPESALRRRARGTTVNRLPRLQPSTQNHARRHLLAVALKRTATPHRRPRMSACGPRRQWDAAQIFALFYVAIAVPYRIGFDHDTAPWEFWFLFDIVVDVYFIVGPRAARCDPAAVPRSTAQRGAMDCAASDL